MKKSLLINAGLLAVIVVLGLAAWLKPAAKEQQHSLSTLKAAEVKSIEVTIGAAAPLVLERVANDWRLNAPLQARADGFQVQRLLEILDAKSGTRFPAAGLARYGLNEPYARLRISGQDFSFGAANEMSREQYVLSGDGIYLLPLRYAAALPKDAFNLLSKQLFAADEAPLAFELEGFKVEQVNGTWTLKMSAANAAAGEAGTDDINRWVDQWRLAGAISVQAATQRKPIGIMKATLKNGSTVVVKILEHGAGTVLAREDQPFEFVMAAETANRLLAPPAAAIAPAAK